MCEIGATIGRLWREMTDIDKQQYNDDFAHDKVATNKHIAGESTVCECRCNAWFPPFRCRSAVVVSPLPLRKFRKNSVSAVRMT